MVGIKNKVQKRKYDRKRQRNRRRKRVGSGTPLSLDDVCQMGANNLEILNMIVDKSKQAYPNLEGAKYLVYVGDLPEGVLITFSNVLAGDGSTGNNVVRNPGSWGWSFENNWQSHYETADAAIQGFLSAKAWFKKYSGS